MKKYLKYVLAISAVVFFTTISIIYFENNQDLPSEDLTSTNKPDLKIIAPIKKQEQLRSINSENSQSVAWLTIPETTIDHPIMQSTDNEFYLNHLPSGEYDPWGCYFADYINDLTSKDSLDANTIIYGHSEFSENPIDRDFTQLFNYLNIDFLVNNPYIYLSLKDEDLVFKVSAVFFTDTDFDYINPNPIDNGISDFYQTIQNKNEYLFIDDSLDEYSTLLTLSTCSYRYDINNTGNHRLVVMAKLLPENALDKPLNIKKNPNAQRPN